MTTNEVREYLKSYRNYKNRVAYIENKILNVHSIQYNKVIGRTSEPKTQNDYILMKEECKKKMESIKQTIEKVNNITYRNILFYRYIECLSVYDIAEIMDYSLSTVRVYILKGITELANILE
ncbi:MAG: hypothetical protein EGQ25_06050 [Catenibacterium mitsuokai]|nr:hypothetical protein [Catenibacterium mitsuokai]